ncbi:MAG: HAMP domain-containing sensor histidine kinase [Ktedonobacteraceae bacterium]
MVYIPLQLRLTCFYALFLTLALYYFGLSVSAQAAQRAYSDLDATLSSRAASVKLGKSLAVPGSLADQLPGIAGVGTEGVAIEVLDDQFHLLATTDGNQGNFSQTSVATIEQSPVPWDAQAARHILQHPFNTYATSNSMYSTIMYRGQQVRVYTLANNDFGMLHIIQTARSEQGIEQSLNSLNLYLLGGGTIFTLCALLGGWLITLGVLTRVRRITRAARAISEERGFSQRVQEKTWSGRDELSELAKTFNTMLDNLERLYHAQQRFIADASHELRAPIASIRCNLDLLAKAPDLPPEEMQAALDDAQIEADRMGRLVNDLLILARSDAAQRVKRSVTDGGQTFETRARLIDLDSLLLEVFRQYRPAQAETKDQTKGQPRLLLQHITPAQSAGDADQMKQALVALVDNALKYTPSRGTVSLTLTTNERWAVFAISDTGIGISPTDLPYIFERFYRADHARSHNQRGCGLGLAIAQSIIKEHQGTIDVKSMPGQGSTFTVRIPLVQAAQFPPTIPLDRREEKRMEQHT